MHYTGRPPGALGGAHARADSRCRTRLQTPCAYLQLQVREFGGSVVSSGHILVSTCRTTALREALAAQAVRSVVTIGAHPCRVCCARFATQFHTAAPGRGAPSARQMVLVLLAFAALLRVCRLGIDALAFHRLSATAASMVAPRLSHSVPASARLA